MTDAKAKATGIIVLIVYTNNLVMLCYLNFSAEIFLQKYFWRILPYS